MSTTSARTRAWTSVFAAGLLAGCVQLSETQCRAADWYQLGYRDADLYGLRPHIDQYAHQCQRFGVQAVEAGYMVGWVDGYREWSRRVMGSDCCEP